MYCISISHKKASVSIRQLFAFSIQQQQQLVKRIKQHKELDGCVILCTCNRSEVYASGSKQIIEILKQEFADFSNINQNDILKYLNIYSDEQAIYHLFKVCCGFDSMILGEDEILGQIKAAYKQALELEIVNYELNVLFQRAIACSKRIKTDTNLSNIPLSITTLVANEVFRFEKEGIKQIMLIGITGKMGSVIAKNILCKDKIQLTATVRNECSFISNSIKIIDYKQRYDYMNEMDIIISATSSPHYTIISQQLNLALKSKKNRLLIDIAVPADIDPKVIDIKNTTLYNIDYFQLECKNNTQIKMKELDRAKLIMEKELDEAIKELIFHPYINQIPKFVQLFDNIDIKKLLFKIRDYTNSDELKVILKTLDKLEYWAEEE